MPQQPTKTVGPYALIFVFMTMLIDTIGLGVIIPVSPGLIAELTHEPISGAARWGGWLFFAYALMQFLFAPVIGNLSDRFGRRPLLILSLAMLGVDYAITGFAPTIAWLFVGRTLSGMAGASFTTVNAYIADITPPAERAAKFGLVGAAFGLGFILGPALGGFVGEHFVVFIGRHVLLPFFHHRCRIHFGHGLRRFGCGDRRRILHVDGFGLFLFLTAEHHRGCRGKT